MPHGVLCILSREPPSYAVSSCALCSEFLKSTILELVGVTIGATVNTGLFADWDFREIVAHASLSLMLVPVQLGFLTLSRPFIRNFLLKPLLRISTFETERRIGLSLSEHVVLLARTSLSEKTCVTILIISLWSPVSFCRREVEVRCSTAR